MGAGNCGDQGEWPCSAIIQPNSHQLCTNCITDCTQTVSVSLAYMQALSPIVHQLCNTHTNYITNCTQTVSLAPLIHPPTSSIVHQMFTSFINNCTLDVSPSPHQLYHQMYTILSPIILPTSTVVHQLYSISTTSFTNYTSVVLPLYHQLMYYNTPIVH